MALTALGKSLAAKQKAASDAAKAKRVSEQKAKEAAFVQPPFGGIADRRTQEQRTSTLGNLISQAQQKLSPTSQQTKNAISRLQQTEQTEKLVQATRLAAQAQQKETENRIKQLQEQQTQYAKLQNAKSLVESTAQKIAREQKSLENIEKNIGLLGKSSDVLEKRSQEAYGQGAGRILPFSFEDGKAIPQNTGFVVDKRSEGSVVEGIGFEKPVGPSTKFASIDYGIRTTIGGPPIPPKIKQPYSPPKPTGIISPVGAAATGGIQTANQFINEAKKAGATTINVLDEAGNVVKSNIPLDRASREIQKIREQIGTVQLQAVGQREVTLTTGFRSIDMGFGRSKEYDLSTLTLADRVDLGISPKPKDPLGLTRYYAEVAARPITEFIPATLNFIDETQGKKPTRQFVPSTSSQVIGGLVESITKQKPLQETLGPVAEDIIKDPFKTIVQAPAEIGLTLLGGQAVKAGTKGVQVAVKSLREPKAGDVIESLLPKKTAVKIGESLREGKNVFEVTDIIQPIKLTKKTVEAGVEFIPSKPTTKPTAIIKTKPKLKEVDVLETSKPEKTGVYTFAQGTEGRGLVTGTKIESELAKIPRPDELVEFTMTKTPKEVRIPPGTSGLTETPLAFIGPGRTALVKSKPTGKFPSGILIRGDLPNDLQKILKLTPIPTRTRVPFYGVKDIPEVAKTYQYLKTAEKGGLTKQITDIQIFPTKEVVKSGLKGDFDFFETFVKFPKTISFFEVAPRVSKTRRLTQLGKKGSQFSLEGPKVKKGKGEITTTLTKKETGEVRDIFEDIIKGETVKPKADFFGPTGGEFLAPVSKFGISEEIVVYPPDTPSRIKEQRNLSQKLVDEIISGQSEGIKTPEIRLPDVFNPLDVNVAERRKPPEFVSRVKPDSKLGIIPIAKQISPLTPKLDIKLVPDTIQIPRITESQILMPKLTPELTTRLVPTTTTFVPPYEPPFEPTTTLLGGDFPRINLYGFPGFGGGRRKRGQKSAGQYGVSGIIPGAFAIEGLEVGFGFGDVGIVKQGKRIKRLEKRYLSGLSNIGSNVLNNPLGTGKRKGKKKKKSVLEDPLGGIDIRF